MKSDISKLYGSKKKLIVESVSNVHLEQAVKRRKSRKSRKEKKDFSLTDLNIRTRKPQNSSPSLMLRLLNKCTTTLTGGEGMTTNTVLYWFYLPHHLSSHSHAPIPPPIATLSHSPPLSAPSLEHSTNSFPRPSRRPLPCSSLDSSYTEPQYAQDHGHVHHPQHYPPLPTHPHPPPQ